MIIRPRPGLRALLFATRGSILPRIASRLLVIAVVSILVALVHHLRPALLPDVSATPFTLIGIALSIFLGFRNNACYDRWWEARRQWGQLVTDCRNLCREAQSLLGPERAVPVIRRIIGFSYGLAARLRGTDMADAISPWVTDAEATAALRVSNAPNVILHCLSRDLAQAMRDDALHPIALSMLDSRVASLCAVQAACERIKSTPTPFAYSLLLHRTAWLFCLLLPVGLVGTAGIASPVVTLIVAYAFFGLDALGDELEEPFALRPNTIPMNALCRTLEIELREALGDPNPPAPTQPIAFVLT
jgi:putative membrane protein